MTNETLIPITCKQCKKESKLTRKESWKLLIIQAGMCSNCFKKNPDIAAKKKKNAIKILLVIIFSFWLFASGVGWNLLESLPF